MKKHFYLFSFLLLSLCAKAQTVKRSKVVSNGGVHGMAYHPNVGMVVLHSGTHLGFPALNAQEVDKETGNPISVDFPFLDGFQDAVSDDNGGWYIVKWGIFYKVDEYIFPNGKHTEILHIKSDYSIDTTFRVQRNNVFPTNFSGGISQIIKYQNMLLVWCGSTTLRLLAFDATTGSYLWDSKTEANFQNLKMQLSQNRLYIAGNFSKVNDITTTTTKAICFNLDTKTSTNWNPTAILSLQGGYGINDMALGGDKAFFAIDGYHRIVAIDTTFGATKHWDVTHNDIFPTKLVADNQNVYCLSQNRHFDVVSEDYSKIAKIDADDGQIDNAWTIPTNYTKKLYGLYLDQNHLYATADDDVTVLGTRTSTLVKISKTNRTVENWKPFNDPSINGASPQSGIINGNDLKLKFLANRVLIGGNFGLLKQNKKEGLAIIRPESESVVDWYPNVRRCQPSVAAFENDSTLWIWGLVVTNDNQNLFNHFAAFDIKTGNLLRYFPTNLPNENGIKKMEVSNQKIIATYEYRSASSPVSGSNGYLQSYNSISGTLENWITCGIVNNFFVVDSLLYTNVGMCINGNYRSGFVSVNLKNNQFTNWIPEYPVGYSGNYEDFVIVGKSVVVMASNKHYEFDRFSGKLLGSFGKISDRGNYITAGEKYFFIARNGNYALNTPNARCGNSTAAYYYDLEYKKFSESCFLQKPVSNQPYTTQSYVDRQFFLAQNYLYFNLSWNGNNPPVGANQNNFLRTSFPKGFFKDEINPAFFPKSGGNSGFVTINFYGYNFIDGCKIRLKKAGQADIVVPDSVVSYPERFRMDAKLNLRGRAIGDWDIEVSLPNGEKSIFSKGFKVIDAGQENLRIVTEIIPPRALRLGGTTKMSFVVTNTSNVDGFGVPIYIYLTKGLEIVSKSFVLDSGRIMKRDSVEKIEIDSIANAKFDGNCYMFLIPQIVSKEILILEMKIKAVSRGNNGFKFGVLAGKSLFNINFSNPDIGSLNNKNNATEEPVTFKSCMRSTLECLLEVALSKKCINILSYIPRLAQQVYFSVAKNEPLYKGVVDIGFTYADLIKCAGGIKSKKLSQLHDILTFSSTSVECISGIYNDCNADRNTEQFVEVPLIASFDPNDKLGPVGVKVQRYVNGSDPFTYKIRFENFATATAAAQYVRLVDTLDRTKFNFDTFQFGYFNVADTNFYASPGKKRHLVDWDLRPAKDLILRMESKFIDSTGILEATYTALDPATMEWTEDPILGFLPPNVNAPEGEGSITFSIFPKDSLATGTTVTNKAYIYFDYNPVIPTPPWTNTIDAMPPNSTMSNLPAVNRDTTIVLSWQGSDAESGAKLYDVMVSVNDGSYTPILLATKLTTFNFFGKVDSTYKFYTVAYDSVYNKQATPVSFATQTMIKFFPLIQSITSGDWNNPNTWNCNCVPAGGENVIIKPTHHVRATEEMNAVCKMLLIEQGAIFEGTGKFLANPKRE